MYLRKGEKWEGQTRRGYVAEWISNGFETDCRNGCEHNGTNRETTETKTSEIGNHIKLGE